MLLECFNCPKCSRPFDRAGRRRAPMFDVELGIVCCRLCLAPGNLTDAKPLKFLETLLEQPDIVKNPTGWVALGPLKPLVCLECKKPFTADPPQVLAYWKFACNACGSKEKEPRMLHGRNCEEELLGPDSPLGTLVTEYRQDCNKVLAAFVKIKANLHDIWYRTSNCGRCQQKVDDTYEDFNKIVIVSCSTIYCAGCYVMTELHNRCHVCNADPHLHVKAGRVVCQERNRELNRVYDSIRHH